MRTLEVARPALASWAEEGRPVQGLGQEAGSAAAALPSWAGARAYPHMPNAREQRVWGSGHSLGAVAAYGAPPAPLHGSGWGPVLSAVRYF